MKGRAVTAKQLHLAKHFYRVGPDSGSSDDEPQDPNALRGVIEPWLSAVFQCEHLGLLLGNGFTTAVAVAAEAAPATMNVKPSAGVLDQEVYDFAVESAKHAGRGEPNIEDYIRSANSLLLGLLIQKDGRADAWRKAIEKLMKDLISSVLKTERGIRDAVEGRSEPGQRAEDLVVSFLLSFASRLPTRERPAIFTTNYDRLIEYACDLAGLRVIDRFVGGLTPVFRATRVDVDFHYNPPGIRGEPRYLEGVAKVSKLHGSLDWRLRNGQVRRVAVPFGATPEHPTFHDDLGTSLMVYPNSAKDAETAVYPYAELFRDFSTHLCRPNSALVVYGYSFGDDHINRVIQDMLTIPSTHVVIIAHSDSGGRVSRFCSRVGRSSQISLLIGSHFGNLQNLVKWYLPKPALDTISSRRVDLLRRRTASVDDPVQDAPPRTVEVDGK